MQNDLKKREIQISGHYFITRVSNASENLIFDLTLLFWIKGSPQSSEPQIDAPLEMAHVAQTGKAWYKSNIVINNLHKFNS